MSRLEPSSSAATAEHAKGALSSGVWPRHSAEPSDSVASMLEAFRARLARHRATRQRLHERLEAQQRFVAGVLARDAEMRDTVREMRAALEASPRPGTLVVAGHPSLVHGEADEGGATR